MLSKNAQEGARAAGAAAARREAGAEAGVLLAKVVVGCASRQTKWRAINCGEAGPAGVPAEHAPPRRTRQGAPIVLERPQSRPLRPCGPATMRLLLWAERERAQKIVQSAAPHHAPLARGDFFVGEWAFAWRKTPAVRRRIAGTAAGLPRPGRARRGWPRTGARAAAALAVGRSAPWAEGIPIAAWATQSEPRGTRNATWASPSASGPSCPRRRLRPAGAARGV